MEDIALRRHGYRYERHALQAVQLPAEFFIVVGIYYSAAIADNSNFLAHFLGMVCKSLVMLVGYGCYHSQFMRPCQERTHAFALPRAIDGNLAYEVIFISGTYGHIPQGKGHTDRAVPAARTAHGIALAKQKPVDQLLSLCLAVAAGDNDSVRVAADTGVGHAAQGFLY